MEYKGYRYPTFWTGGTVPFTFRDIGEEFAVVIGDHQRLYYTKAIYGAPDPAR